MVICPNCQAENRSGAKYCKNCAMRLPASSSVTRPIELDPTLLASATSQTTPKASPQVTRPLNSTPRSGTRPLSPAKSFLRRPTGAIFGDLYASENVIFSDEQQHRYLVRQVDVPDELQIRACPNPSCGAVFPPRYSAPEQFCTDCGSVLEKTCNDLILIEARLQVPDSIVRTAAKGLSHSSVRAPVAAFVEHLAGVPRHCLVVPRVNSLERGPDTLQALKWGAGLARGLDYLQENGISFGGQIDNSLFGLVGDRAVWANFTNCQHHSDGYITDRQLDTHALAALVYQWLTGESHFVYHPNLTPGVNYVFEQALTSSAVSNGIELAELFDKAIEEMAFPQSVDFRLGRRTHVGMVRTLNEDSILTLELNRVQQSVSQPLGIFVVADGMGGHAAGEIASGTIINIIAQKAIKELLPAQFSRSGKQDCQKWLVETVEMANAEVFSRRKSAGTDMGSTLVTAVVEGNTAYVAHIGDSRAYLINSTDIRQLTTDHSLVERLVATGQITREEARHHPQRNVIYRTIGDKSKVEVDVSVNTLAVGDYLLLCSDGLSGMLEDRDIHKLVIDSVSPQAACDALIQSANAAGGDDNVSVIIVKITQP